MARKVHFEKHYMLLLTKGPTEETEIIRLGKIIL